MTAYVIARVEISDRDRYEDYKKLTPSAIAEHNGRFLVRGGPAETLEGADETRRVVVIEFPTAEDARAFYDSPGYRQARAVRAGAADMEMVLVEGV